MGTLVSLDDLLLDELGQFSAHRRARTDVQKQQLFECDRLAALLCVSNLDDNVELSQGPEEWDLSPLVLPDLSESRK